MSVTNNVSRSAVANDGFGDPDLTPKPLRISKREQARPSIACTLNPSHSIQRSQTQGNLQALAPGKKSSTWVNSTQLDLSLQDLAAPISQWARRNTFLHVHKQRQSEPTNTSTAAFAATYKEPIQPIGLSTAVSPARSRDSWPRMSQLGSSSDASQAITVDRPAPTRAFTTGTYRRQNPLSPVHEVSSSPSTSSALPTRRRRAVTNVETFHKDWDSFVSSPHRKVQSQGSTKSSLMSRVMSGLTNRNHANHVVLRQATQTPPDFPPRSLAREEKHSLEHSRSSTETNTYRERNVHDARAGYPTPPTSIATSSTTAESPHSRHSPLPQRFRHLCRPADAVLMGAELALTPEYDEMSTEKERSMWVSLDIKGTTNSTSRVQDVWSQHTGLDIVVIIDNSLHTSPASLMASCETTRFLASILNRITDRLAILCTSLTHTDDTESKVVRCLSEVRMVDVKTDLDAIISSKERLRANGWIDAIHCAKETLLKSRVPDPEAELDQDTFGHVFLLTPDADALPSQSLAHDELTFHIICPASVPRHGLAPVYCNGWKLRSLSGNEAQVVSKKKDLDPMSVTNRLRALIAQARSGKALGNLTGFVLEVSAGPDCSVEGVIGNVNVTELHPGEVFTVLFRLTVRDPAIQEHSLSSSPTLPSEALLDTGDVLSQLDTVLGTTDAKVLTARVTYKHSLLPEGTTCTITSDCHVKRRHPSDPDQEPTTSKFDFHPARDCIILVDKRLAYHLATQGSPRNALKNLHDEFGDRFQLSACRDYITLLANELKHQARIIERSELIPSPKKKLPAIPNPKKSSENWNTIPEKKKLPAIPTPKNPSSENWNPIPEKNKPPALPIPIPKQTSDENRNPISYDAQKSKPPPPLHRATSDISTEELFSAEPALAVSSSRETLRTDEARRIWGDLRRMKKPPPSFPSPPIHHHQRHRHHNHDDNEETVMSTGTGNGKMKGGKRSMTSSQVEEARRVGIREMAVRNKRSVGSDTLRSMFSIGERGSGAGARKGFGAPWL